MLPPQPPTQAYEYSHGSQLGAQPNYGQSDHSYSQMRPPAENMNNNTHYQYPPMPPGAQPPVDRFASMSLGQQQQYPLQPPNQNQMTYSQGISHPPMPPAAQQPQNAYSTGAPAQTQSLPPQYHMPPQMDTQKAPPMSHSNAPPMPPMPPIPSGYPGQGTVPPAGTMAHDGMRNTHYPPPPHTSMDSGFQERQFAHPSQAAYPNGPMGGPHAPQPKRISSEGLPSAVEVIENNRTQCSGPFYTGQRGVAPPLVTTDFSCRDEGNCNPRFIRSSLYAVPTTSDLLKTVGIPFTLTVSPFAELHPDDQRIMISDMGEQGPVRCTRCRAYMNPFASFIDGGRRFQCPLCSGITEVPAHYFAHLDHTGRRTDAYHRPELCLGSYELMATAEYCKNNELPKAPAFLFVLDVSQSAIRSGLVSLFCSRFVDRILPRLPTDEGDNPENTNQSPIRLGFITYDHQIHFYTLNRENQGDSSTLANGTTDASGGYVKPQMNIVADVDEVFVPAVEGFLIPPDPSAIQSLLHLIPNQFGAAPVAPTAAMSPAAGGGGSTPDALLGPAIQAGLEALRAANRPGKLFVFHSNLPTAEAPGKLKNRDDRRLVGTEKEKTLLTPAGDFYTGLGQVCVEAGCSVDLFLFPNSFVDVATVSEVPRMTAGHVYKYNCFQADLQGEHFLSDLGWAVSRPKALNAVMRVRTSAGIRPVEFFGNCHVPNTTDIELACVDPDMAITVELRHDDKLQENDVVFIQAACLYTSISGQRRLRIHNLSLNTTSSIPEVFRIAELDAHMNWFGKFAMRALCSRAHPHVVDELTSRTAHTLAAYRRHCSGGPGDVGASPGELVLPQNMKLFPLYIQCLMKTDAFMPADHVSIDERAWLMFLLNGMDVKQSNAYFYPRLYPVHNLAPNFEGNVYPPPAIRCSYEWLQPDGAYLLDNGVNLFLWLGANLNADWIQAVLNVPCARQFEPERVYDLPRLDNETSRNLCHLIDQIHQEHSRHTRLLVVRPGDQLEASFKRFLVEDRYSGNSVSYMEYLCHIHKEVFSLLR